MSDRAIRERIIEALNVRIARTGGVMTRAELSAFVVDGVEYRLIDTSKGIWNPRSMDATLSILSSPSGPYDDQEIGGGLIHYDYRAGGNDGDNVKLRRAWESHVIEYLAIGTAIVPRPAVAVGATVVLDIGGR